MESSNFFYDFSAAEGNCESLKERRSGSLQPHALGARHHPVLWEVWRSVGPAVLCWSRRASVGSGLRQSIPVICHSISENIKCLC